MWRGLCLCTEIRIYNRTHTSINHKSIFYTYYLLLSPSLSPSLSLCRTQRSQTIPTSIPRLQNSATVLILQLLLSLLTTGFARRQESYLQIQRMPLFVCGIGVSPRGFYLLKNRQIIRRDAGKLIVLATIRRHQTGEKHRWKIDSALVRTSKHITVNSVYISLDESVKIISGQLDGRTSIITTLPWPIRF